MLKNMLIMNLQLFAEEGFEGSETIIPGSDEDFDSAFDSEEEVETEEDFGDSEEVEEEVDETEPGEVEQTQTEEQKFKIKYNKEEKELTLSEMQELAQKGMNYDKKLQEIEAYQNNPGLQYMEKLAAANGVSVSELVEYYNQQEEEAQVQKLISENIPEEYAREILENKKFREQQLKAQKEQEEKAKVEETQKADMLDFMNTFADVKPSDIPSEVWDKVDSGMSLKQAYMENEYEKLKKENTILKQNKTNKKRAVVGSVAGFGSAEDGAKYDPFLDGFNSI